MTLHPDAIRAAIDEIEAAFAGLEPPGDARLLHPRCTDDVDVADFYGAPDWRALAADDEFIIRNYSAPSSFSADAFRYYMPAFMFWSLAHHRTIEIVPECTLQAFDPHRFGYLRDFQISKVRALHHAPATGHRALPGDFRARSGSRPVRRSGAAQLLGAVSAGGRSAKGSTI